MRLFINRMLLFIFPIVLVVSLVELFLRRMDTSDKIKNEQLLVCNKEVELLMLGNSHSAYDLDPGQFSIYAFNLAQVNQSLYFDKRITLKHIDQMKKLKYVLISIDFHSFYFSDEGYRNLWTYYGHDVDYKNELPLLSKWSYAIGYSPNFSIDFIWRYLSKKYHRIKALDVESGVDLSRPVTKGFFAFKNSTYLQEDQIRSRAALFNDIVRQSREKDEIIKDLEGFIGELKKRNITPVFITLPCYGPYRDLLDKKVLEQNKRDILQLSAKYQIQYWDYFTMPLSQDYYYNCDHLNEKGAALFSGVINTRIGELTGARTGPAGSH